MDNQLALTAQRIKELRRIIGKTPEEMAIITGVSVEDYVRCENGESDFSFTFLHKCAKTFGVDIADLLTGEVKEGRVELKPYEVLVLEKI